MNKFLLGVVLSVGVGTAGCGTPDEVLEPSQESASVSQDALRLGAPAGDIVMTQLDVGGLTFDVRMAGPPDGELVILLHGFPQSSYEWRGQLRALGEAGFRAVAPDQRGYSPGARPDGVESYTLPLLVMDVLGLADAIGAERFHVVGHDWGRRWFGL